MLIIKKYPYYIRFAKDKKVVSQEAYEKMIKKGKSGEKLVAAMIKAGFSYKMIKQVDEECIWQQQI